MRNRLIALTKRAQNEWLDKEYEHETHKDLAEYVADHLLANGVIVPPVKVGQRVYIIGWCGDIEEFVVRDVHLLTSGKGDCSYNFRAVINEVSDIHFRDDYIGITVFLTKEEAEKALAEIKEQKC